MCIIVFDLLTNFKAVDAIFFFLLHFFFLFKEIFEENRMKNNFKSFFCLYWWENFHMTPILGNKKCTLIH